MLQEKHQHFLLVTMSVVDLPQDIQQVVSKMRKESFRKRCYGFGILYASVPRPLARIQSQSTFVRLSLKSPGKWIVLTCDVPAVRNVHIVDQQEHTFAAYLMQSDGSYELQKTSPFFPSITFWTLLQIMVNRLKDKIQKLLRLNFF